MKNMMIHILKYLTDKFDEQQIIILFLRISVQAALRNQLICHIHRYIDGICIVRSSNTVQNCMNLLMNCNNVQMCVLVEGH